MVFSQAGASGVGSVRAGWIIAVAVVAAVLMVASAFSGGHARADGSNAGQILQRVKPHAAVVPRRQKNRRAKFDFPAQRAEFALAWVLIDSRRREK